MTLKNPWPSSPHKPPRYSINARTLLPDDEHARVHAVCFTEVYAARIWIDAVRDHATTPIVFTSAALSAIDAHQLSAEEREWKLPAQYMTWIRRFTRGVWDLEDRLVIEATTVTEKVAREKQEKLARDKAPDGWITITAICAGTSIKPMHARAALRAVREKPPFGWAFDPKEVAAIKRLIGA